jgi:CRISPR/Cas system CMR-associated protein Cmr1 (group 7 of RAMP superfamily)
MTMARNFAYNNTNRLLNFKKNKVFNQLDNKLQSLNSEIFKAKAKNFIGKTNFKNMCHSIFSHQTTTYCNYLCAHTHVEGKFTVQNCTEHIKVHAVDLDLTQQIKVFTMENCLKNMLKCFVKSLEPLI